MPAYVAHGAFDNIIPVGFGRRVRDELTEAKLEVIYRETRIQHSVDPELLPEMRDWLSIQTGGPNPLDEGPRSMI
jgi:predicted esterase